jgi:hypothetical protein
MSAAAARRKSSATVPSSRTITSLIISFTGFDSDRRGGRGARTREHVNRCSAHVIDDGQDCGAIPAWTSFAVSSERLSRLAVAPRLLTSFSFARPRLDCRECCGTINDRGFSYVQGGALIAQVSLQTSHPAGLYPDHCPAFGTGEPQGGRHHSVKTGQSNPTPNNGDAPLDQPGRAAA